MKIYADELGKLIRILKTQVDEDQYGPPASYADMLEFDPETNPTIVNHIDTAWNDTTLINGELRYQGTLVTVNPPGQAWIERLRQEDAETTVANVPGWATWTEAEALAWFDANVTDAATAIQVERALVRMVLAMRNKLWPNLEGS